MRRNQPSISGASRLDNSPNARLKSLWKILFLPALIILTSCSNKEKIGEMSLQIESLSMESEYHADTNGVYQLISKKFETRYQGWLNNIQVIDKVDTDEELPDRSAGEYTSFSLQWNDNGSVSIRQLMKTNMDETVPGAAPFIWDKTYEMEFVKGTREDFEAGQIISLQLTEASSNQAKKDLGEKMKETYGNLTEEVIRQALRGKGLDDSSIETETEVVSFSVLNTPFEISKSHCRENTKNSESFEIRTTLYSLD